MLTGLGRHQLNSKAHMGQGHGPQRLHQVVLQAFGCFLALLGELLARGITLLAAQHLLLLKRHQSRCSSTGLQGVAQLITALNQSLEISTKAPLQGLQRSNALLQGRQMLRVSL